MVHVVADISGHSFGHAAQVGPVLSALADRVADLRLTLRARLPVSVLRQFVTVPFATAPAPAEAFPVMSGPTDLCVDEMLAAYRDLHTDWRRKVDAEAARLRAMGADLLVADIPHLGLAAGQAIGCPTAAICSFGWDQILDGYCGGHADHGPVRDRLRGVYGGADVFLRCTPALPDVDLGNTRTIGPVCRRGRNYRPAIDRRLGLASGDRLVVVSFGGIEGGWDVTALPRVPGVVWILGRGRLAGRGDVFTLAETGAPFVDVLASADAVLTKTGYGAFVEAVCHQTRVLYIDRPDWPESRALEPWLHRVGTARAIFAGAMNSKNVAREIAGLLDRPVAAPVNPSGVDDAVEILCGLLGKQKNGVPSRGR